MRNKYLNTNAYTLILCILMSGCAKESNILPEPEQPPVTDGRLDIRLSAEIDQINTTRADDSGFADGDVIGIYAVDFKNSQSGVLLPTGNNTDNIGFRYHEKEDEWKGSPSLKFSDADTPVEVYGYYPYSQTKTNIEEYPVSVYIDQAGKSQTGNMDGYEASDFLWAKSGVVRHSSPSAHLRFRHLLSGVRVTLTEGRGFEKGEWDRLEKKVCISNTKRNANVNLSNGSVTAIGSEAEDIIAKPEKLDFRAVVVPQYIQSGIPMIIVTVGSETYTFVKKETTTYYSGKQHNYTFEVSKPTTPTDPIDPINPIDPTDPTTPTIPTTPEGDYVFELIDESITAWESDMTSHKGESKEYVVVNVSSSTNLQQALKNLKLDPKEIENLKIVGPMHEEDFPFMRSELVKLESLNMYETTLSFQIGYFDSQQIYDNGIPEEAFQNMYSLRHFVFPRSIKCIGRWAFQGTCLSGSLVVPEGVEEIGYSAFASVSDGGEGVVKNNLTGTLTLPSTLKYINSFAFKGCDFSGELLLPESLEEVGMGVFEDCRFFTGDLHIPNAQYCSGVFKNMKGLSGRFVLPSEMTELPVKFFAGCTINSIEWPKNLQKTGQPHQNP